MLVNDARLLIVVIGTMSESLPITTDIAVSLQESSSHEHTTMCTSPSLNIVSYLYQSGQRVTDFFLSLCSWARVTSPNQDLNSHEATEALIPVNISALDYGARDDTSTPTAALGGGEGEGSCPRQDKPGDTMGSGVDSSILLPRPRGDQVTPTQLISVCCYFRGLSLHPRLAYRQRSRAQRSMHRVIDVIDVRIYGSFS